MLFQAAGVLILYMEVEYLQITVSSTIKIEKNLSSTHQKINMTLTIQSSKNWKETTYHHRWTFDGFHLATGAMGGISYFQVSHYVSTQLRTDAIRQYTRILYSHECETWWPRARWLPPNSPRWADCWLANCHLVSPAAFVLIVSLFNSVQLPTRWLNSNINEPLYFRVLMNCNLYKQRSFT
jgi:hypothetical protein